MGTLYIDRKGVELRQEGPRLLVYEQGARTGSVPLPHVERVVLYGGARLDTGVLRALAGHGVGLVALDARRPARTAHLLGRSHNDAARRLAQYQRALDAEWRARWSARLVDHKLKAQQRVLGRALVGRPDRRLALTTALDALAARRRALTMLGDPPCRQSVRGIEGAAAAAYFRGYSVLFPPSLAFTGRNRRPPRDPVNACLSLGYTLLHSDAVRACHVAGLDPLLGFYHDTAFGRESLASDLIETVRPVLDQWVWGLFRERVLRAERFARDKGACLLDKQGRATFYPAYEVFAGPVRRLLVRHARGIARALAEEGAALLEPVDVEVAP